jgi:sigma-B regulation protein RsbU (phosphoserine phosphatase)
MNAECVLRERPGAQRIGVGDQDTPAAIRVLCVDDHLSERIRLTSLLDKLGYQVTGCADGNEALVLLESEAFDLVISDWRMPNRNGLELCRAVREDIRFGRPYFILLTALGAKADLIAAMDAGADDFVTKPYSAEEVRVRVQAGERIVRLQSDLQRQNTALQSAVEREQEFNTRTRQDLDAAGAMQLALLPPNRVWFNGWETASMFRPAEGVAGDIFDCFALDEHVLGFYHLDVAGHGIPAAMLSFTLARMLSPEVGSINNLLYETTADGKQVSNSRPSRVVAKLNERFQDAVGEARFFTLIYGYIDTRDNRGCLCQAGHPHPLLCDASRKISVLGHGGLPVGVFADAEYQDTDFYMEPGSSLILHSDGAPECMNRGLEPFGSERLFKTITDRGITDARQAVQLLEYELNKWLGGAELRDDISALVLAAPEGRDAGE